MVNAHAPPFLSCLRPQEAGLEFVGRDTTGERMEVFEATGHPYFVGAQFHPEFKSRPTKPSPLFVGLLCAASGLPIRF